MSMNDVHSRVFRFLDLVLDVQLHVLDFLVSTDLLALTLVSRYMNYLVTPSLFFNVSFLFRSKLPIGTSLPEGVSVEVLKSSQKAFAKHLIHHPDYAHYVRNLSWQVWGSGSTGSNVFIDVFPLLENVTHLHLINAHPTYLASGTSYVRFRIPPATTYSQLFPHVTSIKFTGTTSMSLAILPLHSPRLLTALSLDTINPHSVALDLLQWVTDSNLSSLRTLSLRTLAPSQDARPCDEVRERQILLAWREALSSVRATVEAVTLGFRDRTILGRDTISVRSGPKSDQVSDLVFPVFSEGSWPCLSTLRLEGSHICGAGVTSSIQHLRVMISNVQIDASATFLSPWHTESRHNF